MKRNLILAGITLLLLALGIVGCLLLMQTDHGTIAVIYQDGTELQRIDLSAVQESYTINIVNEEGGKNTILVEHNAISVQYANCPDQICMKTGILQQSGLPIVCLPNHIVIEIEGSTSDEADARTY